PSPLGQPASPTRSQSPTRRASSSTEQPFSRVWARFTLRELQQACELFHLGGPGDGDQRDVLLARLNAAGVDPAVAQALLWHRFYARDLRLACLAVGLDRAGDKQQLIDRLEG